MSSSQFNILAGPCFPMALCSVMHCGCRFSQISPPTLSTSRERGLLLSSAPLTSRTIFSRGQMAQAKPRPDTSLTYPSAHPLHFVPPACLVPVDTCQGSCKVLCFNDCDPSQSAWSAVCCRSRRDPSSSHAVNSHVCTSYVFQL